MLTGVPTSVPKGAPPQVRPDAHDCRLSAPLAPVPRSAAFAAARGAPRRAVPSRRAEATLQRAVADASRRAAHAHAAA
eukprot:3252887-Prymnesium_polylepis.1